MQTQTAPLLITKTTAHVTINLRLRLLLLCLCVCVTLTALCCYVWNQSHTALRDADLNQLMPVMQNTSNPPPSWTQLDSDYSDYIQRAQQFETYASWQRHCQRILPKSSVLTFEKGICDLIQNITQWTISLSSLAASRQVDIVEFDVGWQYAISTQTESHIVDVLLSESSFEGKRFVPYLSYLMQHDIALHLNDSRLVSIVQTFGNDAFEHLNATQLILQEHIASFGGGIGFGLQLYCQDELILDGGAGGGGGYNVDDIVAAFEYGGGGGIQINNISVGGGTGFEAPNVYSLDATSNCSAFYQQQLPALQTLLRRCDQLNVQSGGGSGSGLTVVNDSSLVAWSYYYLNLTLHAHVEDSR